MGNGTIVYTISANLTNTSRAGYITVADQALALMQNGVSGIPAARDSSNASFLN